MALPSLPHVLLVDDDLAVLRVLDRTLTRLGARVSVAADAETARAIAFTDAVDAIVLDYRLPGMRGTALLRELAAASPRLRDRAVFMTGDLSEEADEAVRATGCPCLMKPFSRRDLEARVRDLLERDVRGSTLPPRRAPKRRSLAKTSLAAPAA